MLHFFDCDIVFLYVLGYLCKLADNFFVANLKIY